MVHELFFYSESKKYQQGSFSASKSTSNKKGMAKETVSCTHACLNWNSDTSWLVPTTCSVVAKMSFLFNLCTTSFYKGGNTENQDENEDKMSSMMGFSGFGKWKGLFWKYLC